MPDNKISDRTQAKEGNELLLQRQYSASKTVMTIEQSNKKQIANYGKILDKFLYKPYLPLPDLAGYVNKYLEVRIHRSYLTRRNKAVKQRNFAGHD